MTTVVNDNRCQAKNRVETGSLARAWMNRIIREVVATHNSVCSENIGVLRRPPYRGRHASDPVGNGFSGLLPVSASGSLELEVLALRHQLAVLHRQRPGRAWLRRGDRLLLGLALPGLASLSGGDGAGQTGNRAPVAVPPQYLICGDRWVVSNNRGKHAFIAMPEHTEL